MVQRPGEVDGASDVVLGLVIVPHEALERRREGLLHLGYEGGIEGSAKVRPAVPMPASCSCGRAPMGCFGEAFHSLLV